MPARINLENDKLFAVKSIFMDETGRKKRQFSDWAKEVGILARLHHKHIAGRSCAQPNCRHRPPCDRPLRARPASDVLVV